MENVMNSSKKHHFVLVHGLGHGAWSWYKVKTMLESSGHHVTALDLAASGVNLKKMNEVDSMLEYTQPLMEFMATAISGEEERVILVGHSLGGLSLAYAMEKFPEKISVGVFLTAFMPDTLHCPSYVMDKLFEMPPENVLVDTQYLLEGDPGKLKTTMIFGPKCLATLLYQLSPPEDLSLGMMLLRAGAMFREDLSTAPKFSEEGYGSVNRAYVICQEDKTITQDFQQWMIQNYPVKQVKKIKGADHMPMMSTPQDVCHALLEIADETT